MFNFGAEGPMRLLVGMFLLFLAVGKCENLHELSGWANKVKTSSCGCQVQKQNFAVGNHENMPSFWKSLKTNSQLPIARICTTSKFSHLSIARYFLVCSFCRTSQKIIYILQEWA